MYFLYFIFTYQIPFSLIKYMPIFLFTKYFLAFFGTFFQYSSRFKGLLDLLKFKVEAKVTLLFQNFLKWLN